MLYFYHSEEKKASLNYANEHIESSLRTHRALHAYIETIQKPEIYRLKDQGKLYEGYFNPKILSFTYIARNVQNFLQEEREKQGLPRVYFKLAASNPRNPINQADDFETKLLQQMNDDSIDSYRDIIDVEGVKYLYVALPVRPNSRSCLRCHSDPNDAPADLITLYGSVRGFNEEIGQIRAFLSIRVPVQKALNEVIRKTQVFGFKSFLILSAIFTVIAILIYKLEREKTIVLARNQELQNISSLDALTGLYNRRYFDEVFAREQKTALRYQTSLSLLLLDLDHFKEINDKYGHLTGDKVLKQFSTILAKNVREVDSAARWGGEEFIILLPQTNIHGASSVAETLLKKVSSFQFDNHIHMTVSIGVTEMAIDDTTDSLLKRLDDTLYQAKKDGRNRVVLKMAKSGILSPVIG